MKKKFGIIILGIAMVLTLAMSGCGVSHKTPEGIVESLIEEYVDGNESKVKECYGQKKDTDELLQKEIDATLKYFKAHNAGSVKVVECGVLSENENYTYVYIIYNLVLEDEQEYPMLGTYMVEKKKKSYYVMSPSDITEEISGQASKDYAEFMKTDSYKDYTDAYNTFIEKNPGYEEKLANKVN